MRESVRKNRENPAKPAVKIIDMKHAIMYNNEIVKVSLFSRKGAKEYHGSKEEITYLCRIKST